jgi:cytochrome c oxidase subunit 3
VNAPELGEQYPDFPTQAHTQEFGMWIFLASEALLFAALFALYAGYRTMYPRDFAEAIHENTRAYGTANMYVLLTSSLAAALSVGAVRQGRSKRAGLLLLVTAVLGLAFLTIKGLEYAKHVHDGALPGRYYHDLRLPTFGGNRFFTMYWVMTGFHALHVTAGVAVVLWMAVRAFAGRYTRAHHTRLEMGTMYWHLVDVIWIFLWPLLYL